MSKKRLRVKDMEVEDTPTMGSLYGSGNPITELLALVDLIIQYKPPRCDCDGYRRCRHCIMQTEFAYKSEKLKKEITRVFEEVK